MNNQGTRSIGSPAPVSRQLWVSYQGMQQTAAILHEVTAHYFPLHGLSFQDFFTFYPVLGFVEALFYQARDVVENSSVKQESLGQCNPWGDYQKLILELLKEHHLEHPLIHKQLKEIGEYLTLIEKASSQIPLTHIEIVHTAELGIADFRLLHALVILMMNKSIDETLFACLRPLETWGELEWNIAAHTDDLAAGRYNVYQMFVNLYGNKALDKLRAEQEHYWSLFQDQIAQLPQQDQQVYLDFHSRYTQTA